MLGCLFVQKIFKIREKKSEHWTHLKNKFIREIKEFWNHSFNVYFWSSENFLILWTHSFTFNGRNKNLTVFWTHTFPLDF